MSSITIIQEHDQITFAVDTARCHGENGIKYRGYEEKVQKVHRTGLDMVFVAGMTECTDYVKSRLQSFVNKKKHINIELLKQCLKKEFPKEECKWEHLGLYDIGVTILSVSNGESIIYSFSQANNYETFISKAAPKQGIVLVDGFDNDRIHGYASSYIKNLKGFEYRKPETFINIYQNNYSEGVGGFIQVYSMDSDGCRMITEQKLNERNLKYVIGGQVIAPKYFSNTITGYSAHITAASIKGSVIEGSTVKS